jgi:arylsulfatase A-like enzyme
MSAYFSCYGWKTVQMLHVDRLAKEGMRLTRTYATSTACSTFRSVMITGMYQATIGAHHHRSERGEHRIQLPDGARSNLTPTQKPARQAAGQISNRN